MTRAGVCCAWLIAALACSDDDELVVAAHGGHAGHDAGATEGEIPAGCVMLGSGATAHVMCNHGHSFNLRSESMDARARLLAWRGLKDASDAQIMGNGLPEGVRLPAPLTPTLRAELGEQVRLRLLSLGPEMHTFHVHGHVWLEDGLPVDNVALLPADARELVFFAGAGATTPDVRAGTGSWMYHCHVETHAASGMWGMFDVLPVGGGAGLLDEAGVSRSRCRTRRAAPVRRSTSSWSRRRSRWW